MKRKKIFHSVKARINTWYAVLMTVLGVVLGLAFILSQTYISNLNLRRDLISQIDENADEVEYESGVFDIDNDFVFHFLNGASLVLSLDGEVLAGDYSILGDAAAANQLSAPEDTSSVTRCSANDKNLFVYDKKISFNKLEFSVDGTTGKITDWSSEARWGDTEAVELSEVPEEGCRISAAQAYENALRHAGLAPDKCVPIYAGSMEYNDTPIILVELYCSEPIYEDLYVRGVATTDEAEYIVRLSAAALAIFLPVYIVLAVLIGNVITKKAFGSVDRLSETVSSVRTHDDLKNVRQVEADDVELRELTDGFNRMLARLESSFEAEKHLTANASHELRTPIAVINAQCELLLDRADLSDEVRANVLKIKKQTENMNKLINDLLLFARLEQGRDHFEFEREDLSIVVQSVCDDVALISDKAIHTDIQENVRMEMDVSLMSRLTQNLVVNAVKYGKENGNVWVTLTQSGDVITFSVRDDGVGIAPEDMEKLFSRFYRVDKARSRRDGGSGLGLSFVDEICSLHGGSIAVHSVLGEGSEFVLTFRDEG